MDAILLLVTALQGSEVIAPNTQVKFAAEVRTPATPSRAVPRATV